MVGRTRYVFLPISLVYPIFKNHNLQSRPTPAHLTSVQAEQILALACENESMNAKRMRVGLDPISQNAPTGSNNCASSDQAVVNALTSYPTFRTTPNQTITTPDVTDNIIQSNNSARNSPLSTNPSLNNENKINMNTGNLNNTTQAPSPMFRSNEFSSPSSSTNSPYTNRTASYPNYFSTLPGSSNMCMYSGYFTFFPRFFRIFLQLISVTELLAHSYRFTSFFFQFFSTDLFE